MNFINSGLTYTYLTRVLLGNIYKTQDVGAFERVGNRPNSSPTEAVIQDFITRGFTVDQLYTMLTEIGHIEGRRILKDYGRVCDTCRGVNL